MLGALRRGRGGVGNAIASRAGRRLRLSAGVRNRLLSTGRIGIGAGRLRTQALLLDDLHVDRVDDEAHPSPLRVGGVGDDHVLAALQRAGQAETGLGEQGRDASMQRSAGLELRRAKVVGEVDIRDLMPGLSPRRLRRGRSRKGWQDPCRKTQRR